MNQLQKHKFSEAFSVMPNSKGELEGCRLGANLINVLVAFFKVCLHPNFLRGFFESYKKFKRLDFCLGLKKSFQPSDTIYHLWLNLGLKPQERVTNKIWFRISLCRSLGYLISLLFMFIIHVIHVQKWLLALSLCMLLDTFLSLSRKTSLWMFIRLAIIQFCYGEITSKGYLRFFFVHR